MNTEAAAVVVRRPRSVPAMRAFAWYEEGMRLFKLAPLNWCLLGLFTLAAELVLQLIPGIGVATSKVVVPVVECGMLIAAAAVDRGAPLDLRYALAAFGVKASALAAIVASALLVFAAEALTGYAAAGINLLAPGIEEAELATSTLAAMFTVGTLISLPVLFVPFAALFDHAPFGYAFATSARGFGLNVLPLLLFGALALVLIAVGLLSFGVALVAILPLISAASYAAWKDVYGLEARPRPAL